jgi:CRP-like cAMP-binding protein
MVIDYLKKILPDLDWNKYLHLWRRLEVPAKNILLKEGEISRKAYFIEKGCLRLWFNNDGKDITFQFFFENEGVSSIESFSKNIPSLFYLETIEPSFLWYIEKKDFDILVNEIPAFKELLFEAAFDRQIHYMKHFLSLIKDKPVERYRKLLKEKPELLQRVPQHYIASYLGITSVSLSRIRNKK